MQFPVAMPNDGMVDLVIQGMVGLFPFFLALLRAEPPFFRFFLSQLSRTEMLKSFDGAEKGATYWHEKVSIFLEVPAQALIAFRRHSTSKPAHTGSNRCRQTVICQ
jgi:hypothetical protein